MKRKYKSPQIEIFQFELKDIILESTADVENGYKDFNDFDKDFNFDDNE